MKINTYLTIATLTITTLFAEHNNIQEKSHNDLWLNSEEFFDELDFVANYFTNPVIETPNNLKQIDSFKASVTNDSKTGFFSVAPKNLKASHLYMWILQDFKEEGSLLHLGPIVTDSEGRIDSLLNEKYATANIEKIENDQMIISILLDIEDQTYTVDSLTLFPNEYKIGSTGTVKFRMKLPIPVAYVEFEGMNPMEQVLIRWEEELERTFTMDENGMAKGDLWLDKSLQEDQLNFQIQYNDEQINVLVPEPGTGTINKAQIVLQTN